jgi:hypothetical protein
VNNISNTLFAVYQRLHVLVEEEMAEKRELSRLEWTQRISDAWEVAKAKYFYPEDYGWLQYRRGSTIQGMREQFERESWEIYRRSNILWEEKEMLCMSSLGERQRMLLRFLSPPNSEDLDDVLSNNNIGVTGNIEGQSNTL